MHSGNGNGNGRNSIVLKDQASSHEAIPMNHAMNGIDGTTTTTRNRRKTLSIRMAR